jgi:asparagine synthase (glutamine-hydrolysing)
MPPERAHIYWNGTFSDQEKHALLRRPLTGPLERILRELSALQTRDGDDLAPFLWWDQKYYLADDILVKSDRMSMAHAVEVRPAFLDHRIVEFAAGLPARLKISAERQKLVLRELMKGKLPPATLRHGKIGFDIPAHDWLRGPLRGIAQETLRAGAADYCEVFRGDLIEGLLQRHLSREINVGYHLWGLLILFQWMRKWSIRAAPAEAAQPALQVKAGSYT